MSMIGIDLKGLDQVIDTYVYRGIPNYQVMSGKDLKFYYAGNNIDEGREVLMNNLKVVQDNGSTAVYKIIYFDGESDGKLNKSEIVGSNSFRLLMPDEEKEMYRSRMAGVGSSQLDQIKQLLETLIQQSAGLESRIAALEAFDEEEDEPEEKKEGGIAGLLSGILEDPQIKSIVVNGIVDLVKKVKPGNAIEDRPVPSAAVGNISAEDVEKMNQAILILMDKGMTADDLTKLANIAKDDPITFTFLLNKLRS